MVTRRAWIGLAVGGVAQALLTRKAPALPAAWLAPPEVTVYKSPTCGCCKKWVDHLRANGFTVRANDVTDVDAYKTRYGVPAALGSCHTAVVGGYAIEGHVPADLIHRLLKEKPKVVGLAVPGMPMGSPGMEGPTAERYEVLSFTRDGTTRVFARR